MRILGGSKPEANSKNRVSFRRHEGKKWCLVVISLKAEGLIVFLEMMWQTLALEYNHKSLVSASYNLLHY